jgi:hypothetical protein
MFDPEAGAVVVKVIGKTEEGPVLLATSTLFR